MNKIQGDMQVTPSWLKTKQLLKEYLYALSLELAGRVNEFAPQGNMLKGSFVAEPVQEMGNAIRADVGTPIPHAMYVELGTRPHWAPIQPLINWAEHNVQIHLKAIGVEFKEGKALPTRKGTIKLKGIKKTNEITRFAYAVRAVIAKRGTKAQRYMERALLSLGLPFTLRYEPTGATYDIDVTTYINQSAEKIMRQSGMVV